MLALAAGASLLAGCGEDPALDERAVAKPVGRVRDLSFLSLGRRGKALAWRESIAPNDAEAKAAFLLLAESGAPRGAVLRDENPSTASSALVATGDTILRVLAERGEPDAWGLVAVVRDIETGELLPDGYRTLPLFAGATLTDLRLVPSASGALLAWVERAGGELPADLVTLVALDPEGTPLGSPIALTELPTEVVRIDLVSFDDGQQAVLTALARRGGSAQIWVFHLRIDDGLRIDGDPRPLTTSISADDRVLDLETDGDCVEMLITQGGAPVAADLEPGNLAATQFEPLNVPEEPGAAPRLVPGSGDSLLYLYDLPDGGTRVRAIEHGNNCLGRVGDDRSFPLSRHRCAELSTVVGDALLPYACATACLTKNCGEEWIYVGRARL